MDLQHIHELLIAAGARRASSSAAVYELSQPFWPFGRRSRQFPQLKERVLDAVRSLSSRAFLAYDEDPHEWGLPGEWKPAGSGTWEVPGEPSSSCLLDGYLSPGNWTLYLAEASVAADTLPDTFRAPLEATVGFARSNGISLILDSWHDNTTWRLVVEPSTVPGGGFEPPTP